MTGVMPKVSMLIISYNEKNFLSRAISSSIAQTYANKEIIVGDDGSNDGSIEFIKELGDSIRFFIMRRDNSPVIPSIRVSNVIKRGIKESVGKYFTILSGDDYYTDPHMIEEAVNYLEGHPDYAAYIYGFTRVNEMEQEIDKHISRKQSRWMYWSGDYTHISCFVFRTPKDETLLDRMCDDTGLEFVLAQIGKWKFSEKVTLAYRQREKSIQHDADLVELAILEAMIYQDILNYNGKCIMKLATLSRFYRPMRYLEKNKNKLNEPKYSKYIESCAKYDNDILNAIIVGENVSAKMWFYNRLYAVKRRLLQV